jgi:hypothetical protein
MPQVEWIERGEPRTVSVNAFGKRGSRWIRPWTVAAGYGLLAALWIYTSGELLDQLVGRDGQAR